MAEEMVQIDESTGSVKIADDVISTIAGMACLEVSGIVSPGSAPAAGIAEFLGKKSVNRGIKVEVVEDKVNIDIYAVIEYGSKVQDVAKELQTKVKTAVESMTGVIVERINVHIQGVTFDSHGTKKPE